MKKILSVILLLTLVLCSCKGGGGNDLSSLGKSKYSEYNTKNASNVFSGGIVGYDEESETLYYMDFTDETFYPDKGYSLCPLVAQKGDEKTVISMERAVGCIYVFGDKIYYQNRFEIVCINKDGSNRKVLYDMFDSSGTSTAKNIIPYWDGVLYIDRGDNKIHKITQNGEDVTIETSQNVWRFMLYNGNIYYCGYDDHPYRGYELRCYELEAQNDYPIALREKIHSFNIYDDKLFVFYGDKAIEIIDKNGDSTKVTSKGGYITLFPREDGFYYFEGNTEDTSVLMRYDYEKKTSEAVYTPKATGMGLSFLCGPYICNNGADSEIIINRWK